MNLRDVRKKIKTVRNVKKITNAMQMVSAVKMKKAQAIALEGREYRRILDEALKRILSKTPDIQDLNIPWLQPSEGTKTLYVLIASNKGLCGAFHANLFKYAADTINTDTAEFVTVGQKGAEFASFFDGDVLADFSDQVPFTDNISGIFSFIEERYLSGQYKDVYVVYNKFISSFKNEPIAEQLLPVVDIEKLDKKVGGESELSASYLIEPSVEELLKPLIKDYAQEKLRSAISDSEAAEHSARMMAMKTATDNAGEVTNSLTLLRNKLRQTQITNELLDMIAAMQSTE